MSKDKIPKHKAEQRKTTFGKLMVGWLFKAGPKLSTWWRKRDAKTAVRTDDKVLMPWLPDDPVWIVDNPTIRD